MLEVMDGVRFALGQALVGLVFAAIVALGMIVFVRLFGDGGIFTSKDKDK